MLNLLRDDWKLIPQNYRYLFIFGVILVFHSWLLDHWGSQTPLFLKWNLTNISYILGISIIFISIVFITSKQIYFYGNTSYLRNRYPINKLDISFYLVWFNGKLILFDKKRKRYFHVYPWKTAQKLNFTSRGFSVLTDFMPTGLEEFPANFQGDSIKMKDYEDGGSITTEQVKKK